jgi:hypothetical protein
MKWLHLWLQLGPVAFTIAYMIKTTWLMMCPNSPKNISLKK